SLGNVSNLLDLLERYDGRTYRMLLLQSHYRSPITITLDNLGAAEKALAGLDAFVARLTAAGDTAGDTARAAPDPDVLGRFVERMDDDLDTPGAMAILFETVRRANAGHDAGDDVGSLVAAVGEIASALGVELRGGVVDDDAATLAAALDAARAAKDYAEADRIRGELQAAGWIVETGAQGTTVRR
ncbi:MAG: DALR domain-containing protein, partial [Desertimonas sp.]